MKRKRNMKGNYLVQFVNVCKILLFTVFKFMLKPLHLQFLTKYEYAMHLTKYPKEKV